MGAYHKDILSGITLASIFDKDRLAHRAFLWGAYVEPSLQGQHIGKNLLLTLIDHLAGMRVKQFLTTIISNNVPSLKMCRSIGFIECFIEKNGIKSSDGYLDAIHLIEYLD